MEGCWALVGLAVGWMFAPAILIPIALIWTWFHPHHPYEPPPYIPIPPPLPPAPLTDAELACRMRQARIMRQRVKRGLV